MQGMNQSSWHKGNKLKEELPDTKSEGCAAPHSKLTFPVLLKAAPKSTFLCAQVRDGSWLTLVIVRKNINLTDTLKKNGRISVAKVFEK